MVKATLILSLLRSIAGVYSSIAKFLKKEIFIESELVPYWFGAWEDRGPNKVDLKLMVTNKSDRKIKIKKVVLIFKKGSEHHTITIEKSFELDPKNTYERTLKTPILQKEIQHFKTFRIVLFEVGTNSTYRSKETYFEIEKAPC